MILGGDLIAQCAPDAGVSRGPEYLAGRGHAGQGGAHDAGHSRVLSGQVEAVDGGRGRGEVGSEALGCQGQSVEASALV